jgi:glycosyltransferase involved in cell wall biosynthesis
MRRCPAVIHISDHARALCIANVRGKTWVVENPVAEDFFGVRRSLQPRVLFSGKISPLKNVLRLLQAFRELGEAVPDAELRLAGPELPGDYGRECRNYVERQGLTGRVRFLGSLGRAEMLDELAAASCLVLLSYQENAPLAIAEAMAAGVPVVGSRVGGIPYMIDEGATGFVVDPDDHLEAAARVRLLLSDPGLNYRFSVECRRVALQRFSLPSVLEKTMSIYQQVLSRERSISSLS